MTKQEVVKKLDLAWRHFYVNAAFDKRYLTNAELHPIIVPQTMEIAVAQITVFIAGERVKEIRYPLDWWQAFKERWFPKWLLKWKPVVYHTWKIDFLYPELKLRGEAHPEIAIYDSQRSRGYPSWEDTPREFPKDEDEED